MAEAGFRQASRTESTILTTSIWNDVHTLSRGIKPIDLGVGFPNFDIPAKVRQDLIDVSEESNYSVHQYAKGFGHARLTTALCELYAPLLGQEQLNSARNVMITSGASEALFVSFMGLINPGDEVILIEPFYDAYLAQVLLAAGTPVFVPLRPSSDRSVSSADWTLDAAELEAAFSPKTKVLVLNTPNNPTGKVFSLPELEMIAGLCRERGVVVISDEVYEWIVHDELSHVRIASLPGMWERTITIGSAGKVFSATGWRIGWAIAPAELLNGPRYVLQLSGYIVCTPIQEALARSFERETALFKQQSPECHFKSMQHKCQQKRDQLAVALKSVGLHPIVPEGGYFMLADIREIMTKLDLCNDSSEVKDVCFMKWLLQQHGLLAIPPSHFYSAEHKSIGENYIRFCFFKDDATLDQAIKVLQKMAQETF